MTKIVLTSPVLQKKFRDLKQELTGELYRSRVSNADVVAYLLHFYEQGPAPVDVSSVRPPQPIYQEQNVSYSESLIHPEPPPDFPLEGGIEFQDIQLID